ncbi:hypothetical protein [Leptospira santarosai]|uniref:hypothetical protein n=1 Tax=Leptospira santarosai TaxID=28183 RepID=UPI0002D65022|nr:hypothetical protein [Leptospira santarosai]
MKSSDRYPFKVPPKTSRIFTLLRVLIRNLLVLGQALIKPVIAVSREMERCEK